MSGLDKITERLNEECAAQCAGIEAAAHEKAEQITARAQADGNALIREYESAARKQADALVARADSAGALEARREALRVKTELVEDVLADAKRMLRGAAADVYFERLGALIARHAQPGEGVLFFGENDLRRMPEAFRAALPAGISVSAAPAPIGDGFILKYGDVEINCTFDALFAAAHDDLTLLAAQMLFV